MNIDDKDGQSDAEVEAIDTPSRAPIKTEGDHEQTAEPGPEA